MCQIRRVKKRIEESILQCFSHIERMQYDKIAKRVYVGDSVGSHLVGQLQKRWTNSVTECLRK